MRNCANSVIGACDEFVSSGRLDNQGTCYTATRALIDSLNQSQEEYNAGKSTFELPSGAGADTCQRTPPSG